MDDHDAEDEIEGSPQQGDPGEAQPKEVREDEIRTEEIDLLDLNAPPPHAHGSHLKWYVVHTYSGYENRAKKSLEEWVKQRRLGSKFGEILVPTENIVELGKGGQKKTRTRKVFPGYMLVQMELDDETWHVIKSISKITGFVGSALHPSTVPEEDVRRLTQGLDEGTLQPKFSKEFEEGDNVRVIGGQYNTFEGVVSKVFPEKGQVEIMTSILGRLLPISVSMLDVEKHRL